MQKWTRDLICSIVILIFCVVMFAYSTTLRQRIITEPLASPNAYMQMWLIAMGLLAVALMVRSLRARDKTVQIPIFTKLSLFTIVVFFIFLYSLPYLGFFLAALLFLLATILAYSAAMGKLSGNIKKTTLRIGGYVVFALVTVIATDFIFRTMLSVFFPVGSLWR